MKTQKSNLQLPLVSVTADDVKKWAERRWQTPTIAEATRWLARHRSSLRRSMGSMLSDHLDELLDDAALGGYPDPRVNRLYRWLDNAIYHAAEAYGKRIGKQLYRWAEPDFALLQIADLLCREKPDSLTACVDIDHEYCAPSDPITNRRTVHRTKRVHLMVSNSKLEVELVNGKNCCHGADWFVP